MSSSDYHTLQKKIEKDSDSGAAKRASDWSPVCAFSKTASVYTAPTVREVGLIPPPPPEPPPQSCRSGTCETDARARSW